MFSDRISSFYGKGLIAAVLFKDAKSQEPDPYLASKVAELCMQRGLLVVHTARVNKNRTSTHNYGRRSKGRS